VRVLSPANLWAYVSDLPRFCDLGQIVAGPFVVDGELCYCVERKWPAHEITTVPAESIGEFYLTGLRPRGAQFVRVSGAVEGPDDSKAIPTRQIDPRTLEPLP